MYPRLICRNNSKFTHCLWVNEIAWVVDLNMDESLIFPSIEKEELYKINITKDTIW